MDEYFIEFIEEYRRIDIQNFFAGIGSIQVEEVLNKSERLTPMELLMLLSPAAESYLEIMAQKAHEITVNNFGKTILLYTPLYLSDYCRNSCRYCSFNHNHNMQRHRLSFSDVEKEAESIASTGLKHILLLTGSDREMADPGYLETCIGIMKKYFSSIGLEIYAMAKDEYCRMVDAGADNLTMYQETYDRDLYSYLHPSGPKSNYYYRINAPERGCKAGMRSVQLGALLGLRNWREDLFFTCLHAHYLQTAYPSVEVGISLPRLKPHRGSFQVQEEVGDRHYVQAMTAFRMFMPRGGVAVSTREAPEFRDNLIPLGTTKMSAGSSTAVGGHTQKNTNEQFQISDLRSVKEVYHAISMKGYQPVFKDWQPLALDGGGQ